MTELIVDYVRKPRPLVLREHDTLFLDREFLSQGGDRKISRAPRAPQLIFMREHWWILNCDERLALLSVFVERENRRFPVGERCAFPLTDGDFELRVWEEEYRVGIRPARAASLNRGDPQGGEETVPALPESVLRVLDLFERQARHKVVLATYCLDYFSRGLREAKPLPRPEIMKCMGLDKVTAVEAALDDISLAIWGVAKGHRHEIARYLIDEGLISAKDLGLVPHRACDHRPGRRS